MLIFVKKNVANYDLVLWVDILYLLQDIQKDGVIVYD